MGTPLTREELRTIYSILQSELKNLPVETSRFDLEWSGFDITRIPEGLSAEVMPIVNQLFQEMQPERQWNALCRLAEYLTEHNPFAGGRIQKLLGKQGLQYRPRDSKVFARIDD